MKRIIAATIVLLAGVAPAGAAETSASLPDAYPACMERNGPDCVLRSQVVPPRVTAPPTVIAVPPATTPQSGVVVIPAVTMPVAPGLLGVPATDTGTSTSTDTTTSTTSTTTSRGITAPQGVTGAPAGSTVIAPTRGATIISPRKK